MTNTKQHIALHIAQWSVENNCDYFHIFAEYHGHVNTFSISWCIGGWKMGKDRDGNYMNIRLSDIDTLTKAFNEMKIAKQECDVDYSPKNREDTEAKVRAERINELERELLELKGEE